MKYTALFFSALALFSGVMGFQTPSMPKMRESKTSVNIFNRNKKSDAGSGSKIVAQGTRQPPKYLKTPAPGQGEEGAFYVRQNDDISTALPWVTRPEIGDGDLVGDVGFDPFGLSKQFDVNYLRAAELKHGRVAMVAALGLVTPELVQTPAGFKGFDFPAEFSEMNAYKALLTVPKLGLAQIVLAIAFIEVATFSSTYNEKFNYEDNLSVLEREKAATGNTIQLTFAAKTQAKSGLNEFGQALNVGFQDREKIQPGDLGFDPLGFTRNGVNPAYAEAEIKHARLAMIGVAGMLLQEFYQDKGIVAQTAEWAKQVTSS
jgi:hypothetical protein